jgi:mannosyl-3-phosphoglycerate phosphatase
MYTKKSTENILIFTDLDGTLLEHHSYSYKEAMPMLDFIKKNKIPLILVTSKTKEEVMFLQKALETNSPFIVENGAGIIMPNETGFEDIILGYSYEEIREAFVRYAKSIPMQGFFDMSIEEIISHTGLGKKEAIAAKNRTFTEPFILRNVQQLGDLKALATFEGLDVVKGGRFYHLITKGVDKAQAIRSVIKHYERLFEHSATTIALGDSANDLTMLQSADIPILMPHFDGSYLDCMIPNLIKAPKAGPGGWNSALKKYFDV